MDTKKDASVKVDVRADGTIDPALREATERFVASVDAVDVDAVAKMYAPDFICVRVTDDGGLANLSRDQMLAFLSRASALAPGQAAKIITRDTKIQHAERIGDKGYVLMTRTKDIGNGWEPMFYSLVWQQRNGGWQLQREYVHQRTTPRWR